MMYGLAESMAEVASQATVRLYVVCSVHLILCIALIATLTPGDESLTIGGVVIHRETQWAFGAFNCVCLVIVIMAAVGNLYTIESHLGLYYYTLLVSILVDIALLTMFAIMGAKCSPTNHFSSHVECKMLGGSVSAALLALILCKVLAMMITSKARRALRNKYNEDLLPYMKASLGASLAPAEEKPEAASFRPAATISSGQSMQAATIPPSSTVMRASGAAERALVRPRVSSLRGVVEATPVTMYGSSAVARPVGSTGFVAGRTAPPAMIAGSAINMEPMAMPAQIAPVSMPVLSQPVPSSLAHIGPSTGRKPVLEVSAERLLEPPEPDALCPALVLTRGESEVHFMIEIASIRRLSLGDYPVEILGPSGRALLHARLPSNPSIGPQDATAGLWLELCTTPTSNFPHGSVGPMLPGVRAEHALEIRGPSGQVFGTLEPTATGWCVQRRNRTLLSLEVDVTTSELKTFDPSGRVLAQAAPISEEALQIQMESGVDALLNLICLLSALLMSFGQAA